MVYLQARTEVLLERIAHRGRREEAPIEPDYVRQVAEAYAEFFFNYNDSPLLIVNASDIDFVANAEDRAALIDVIRRTRGGHQPLEPQLSTTAQNRPPRQRADKVTVGAAARAQGRGARSWCSPPTT